MDTDSAEVRLRQLVARTGTVDPMLRMLAFSATRRDDVRVGIPIGLITNGVAIRGILTDARLFAEEVDSILAEIAAAATSEVEDGVVAARIRKAYSSLDFSSALEKQDTERNDFLARWHAYRQEHPEATADPATLPSDLAHAVLDHFDWVKAVTLEEAEINQAGTWIDVGFVRLSLNHVAAWWPLRLGGEEGGETIAGEDPTS